MNNNDNNFFNDLMDLIMIYLIPYSMFIGMGIVMVVMAALVFHSQ